jgi:phage tail sheath gpL-like
MSIGNTGVSANYKVPRYIALIVFAAGALSAGSVALKCLCVGMKTAAGSLTADTDFVQCTSEDQADALAGPGSQLAMQAYQALKVPGINLWLAAVTEPGAGTAATVTIAVSGTQTTGGVLRFRVAGKPISVDVGLTDTPTNIGDNIAAAINARVRLPVTALDVTGTVTVSTKNKGTDNKKWVLVWDKTDKPAGLTVTITGATTLNTTGQLQAVTFGVTATGTGAVDATALLTKFGKSTYGRIAVGHNDVTNAALWKTQVNSDGGPLSLLLEQLVFGSNDSLATTMTLAQTTLNAFRAQVCWLRNSENHPCEIAALVAAIRSVQEQANPITDFDGMILASLAPQTLDIDQPSDAEQNQALNNGVTPLTTVNGQVRIVRAITTYCLNGSNQDERCLDIGDAAFTDYAAIDAKALYDSEFRPANPLVGPDFPPDITEPPAGVGYPLLWNSKLAARMQRWFQNGWQLLPPTAPGAAPVSTFDAAGNFIKTDTPVLPRRLQHRLDNVIREIRNT